MLTPPKEVIKAFNLKGKIRRLNGGQGNNFLVGNFVLKHENNSLEHSWIAKTLNNIKSSKLRLPKYIKSKNNKYVEHGWLAYEHLEGKHYKAHWKEKKEVSENFHKLLKEIPCSKFFRTRKDPWSIADRMAWGDEDIKIQKEIRPYADKIIKCIKPIKLRNQIIHGDIQGNILFSKIKTPAVIDFSLYYRPADFALAVMVVDALVWEGASTKILNLFKGKKEFTQLLLRAELRRILEIGLCVKYLKKGNIKDIYAHEKTIDFLCNLDNE